MEENKSLLGKMAKAAKVDYAELLRIKRNYGEEE